MNPLESFAQPDVLFRMLAVGVGYAALFGACEGAGQVWRLAPELTRKIAHVVGGAIALGFPLVFDSPWPVIALAVLFVVLLAVTARLGLLGSIHGVDRATIGAILYPVGVAIALVGAQHHAAWYSVAILSLSLGDAAAGVVGSRWGRLRFCVWRSARSVEGSLAAFGVSAAATALVLSATGSAAPLIGALLVGAAVAVVEAVSPGGTDNVTVPVVALIAVASPSTAAAVVVASICLLVLGVSVPRSVSLSETGLGPSHP